MTTEIATEGGPMEGSCSAEMEAAQKQLLIDGPAPGSRWRHFKGGIYVVVDNIVLEDTLDHIVYYVSEKTGFKIGRRLSVFLGVHPGHNVKRFEQIE